MKILYLYQYFGTPKGGWSTRVYEFCRRWAAAGHKVIVVTAPFEKSDIKAAGFITRMKVEGIKVIVINLADSNRNTVRKRAFKALLFSLASTWYALRIQADVVIASSGPITMGIPGLAARWLRRAKLVFEVRDLWPQGAIELKKITNSVAVKMGLWFEKVCYREASLVVACSSGMESSIRGRFPKVNTMVIPNASDPELFSIPKTEPFYFPESVRGKKIFLYAGSLGLIDECMQIVKASALLRRKDIATVFVGEGPERIDLEKEARRTGNPDIYFIGLIPKTEVAKWFSQATASIVTFADAPSLQESSPNKMFDSFASGVPVIQTTRGWIKELVEKEQCGINVGQSDPEGLAQAMAYLADNPEERSRMAANAKRLAYGPFNRDILAERYLNALLNLGHSGRAGKP